MRFVGISLAAVGLSSLFLSVLVVHAILAPVSHHIEQRRYIGDQSRIERRRKLQACISRRCQRYNRTGKRFRSRVQRHIGRLEP